MRHREAASRPAQHRQVASSDRRSALADFADGLPVVNGAGEQSPGYVWRLQSDSGDATDIQVFDDPLIIVNLTVWESLEALQGVRLPRDPPRLLPPPRRMVRRRSRRARLCGGSLPVCSRRPTTPSGGSTSSRCSVPRRTPSRWVRASRHSRWTGSVSTTVVCRSWGIDPTAICSPTSRGRVVVTEIDDVPVACGAYRMLDRDTVEIRRMHVAQSARGMRVGAAIVAELETVARADGTTAAAAGDLAAGSWTRWSSSASGTARPGPNRHCRRPRCSWRRRSPRSRAV